MMPLDHIATILQSFAIEPKPLDRIVADYLRRHRAIGSRERRLIGDVVFGVARWRRRLDGFLALQGHRRPADRRRVLCFLFAFRPDGIDFAPYEAASRDAGVTTDAACYAIDDPKRFPGGMAAWCSFPDWLFRKLVEQEGEESAREIALALNKPAPTVLRVNTLQIDRDAALAALREEGVAAEATARSPFGIVLSGRVALDHLPLFRDGGVEVQDEASQLAAIVAAPQPGERVLDCCAGAGGKALALAMLMAGRGRIDAADTDAHKLRECRRRAKRAGVQAIRTIGAEAVPDARYDCVLVDAPCSGTGTLRRSPDRKWRLDADELDRLKGLQRDLLTRAATHVRPRGRIVYATCSVLQEENEGAIAATKALRGFHPLDAAALLRERGIDPAGIVREGALCTDPRTGPGDGFFARVLLRPA